MRKPAGVNVALDKGSGVQPSEQQACRMVPPSTSGGAVAGFGMSDISERIAAMTSDRPQRPALAIEKVAGILKDLSAKGIFDAEFGEACAQIILQEDF